MRLKNLLDQLLKLRLAVRPSLAFHFQRQLIKAAYIVWVEMNRFTEIANRRRGIPACAFQSAQIGVDLPVARQQRVRTVQSLFRLFEVALPERQDSPIRPGRRLSGSQLRRLCKRAFRPHVISHFHRGQTHIKRLNKPGVFRRFRLRQVRAAARQNAQRGRQQRSRQTPLHHTQVAQSAVP